MSVDPVYMEMKLPKQLKIENIKEMIEEQQIMFKIWDQHLISLIFPLSL